MSAFASRSTKHFTLWTSIVAAARVSSCLFTAPRVEFASTQVGGKDMW